jgi:integrin alpha FG-GAP repeat containing protein 1
MQTPYSLFGLGRTNNYVEVRLTWPPFHIPSWLTHPMHSFDQNLFIGSTLHTTPHHTSIEGIIPNSQVVISPPSSASLAEGGGSWSWELYLHPGEYVPWVTFSVIMATLVLAGVVGLLHVREKKEDELERRRALHKFNPLAM